MIPLPPKDGADLRPYPLVDAVQYSGGLEEAEVAPPPDKVAGQFRNEMAEADALCAERPFPDLSLEPDEKAGRARHDSLTRPPLPRMDIAVVGVADEAVAALLQFLVRDIQHQVRQQWRERFALRSPLGGRADRTIGNNNDQSRIGAR